MTSIRSFRLIRRILGAARAFDSAGRVASAVENGRSPEPGDLARLGISVTAFEAINRI